MIQLALFDLDHTLLPIDSDHEWGRFTQRLGWLDDADFEAKNDLFFAQYQRGELDGPAYVRFATRAFVSRGQARAFEARARFMHEVIEPHIHPQAKALLQSHRDRGDEVLIVTATNEFVTGPIAQALGVEHLIAVQLARDDQGWFTGEIEGVPSMKAGKVTRVEQWLLARGLIWAQVSQSTFYSDSMNDIALLERVSHPVATNPSAALRHLAHERGWPVLDLFTKL